MFPAQERIEAAIRLEKPDRVPFAPILDVFAASYGGVSQREMLFDIGKADEALANTIKAIGGIDAQHISYAGIGELILFMLPNRPRIPGMDGVDEGGEWQFVEKSVMGPEEYAEIARRGAAPWMLSKLSRTHPEIRSASGLSREVARLLGSAAAVRRSIRRWRSRGVDTLGGPNQTFLPTEFMSLNLRSFKDFTLDLFRRPEEVKAACRAFIKPFEWLGLALARATGLNRVYIGGARTSASAISPAQFEEFALPEWLQMCEFFAGHGITTVLHLDSDWTAFFPYLRNLPARKCVLNLDGTSDIYKAKEILGDHMCIMGDVPASLLKLGEPGEVDEYCRRLIKDIGSDGGFILSSGCSVPIDAKPENVRAMSASVRRYR